VDPGERSETALICAAQKGETDAYDELVRRHRLAALRVALSVTGDPDEAEDATQDACIKAFYALDRFEHGAPFRPWLLRIVANEARNRRRSVQRRAHLAERVEVGSETPDVERAEPEAVFLERERQDALRSALSGLRPEDRQVVDQRYFAALSEAEMADTLGIARGTVKSRLSRAMARLRTALAAATLALVLLIAAILAASREARDAVADRLGLHGVDITHVPGVFREAPLPSIVTDARLGAPVSLDQARSRNASAFFEPTLDELGPVRAAYIHGDARWQITSLVYTPAPGTFAGSNGPVVFMHVTGSLEPAVLGKGIGPEATVTSVDVGGHRGFWLAGHPHTVMFRDTSGEFRDDNVRLAGSVLLWEVAQGGILLRLEGVASLTDALRVAGSVARSTR
jgi:RNA polymerase sigma factor (sigma-70 family)